MPLRRVPPPLIKIKFSKRKLRVIYCCGVCSYPRYMFDPWEEDEEEKLLAGRNRELHFRPCPSCGLVSPPVALIRTGSRYCGAGAENEFPVRGSMGDARRLVRKADQVIKAAGVRRRKAEGRRLLLVNIGPVSIGPVRRLPADNDKMFMALFDGYVAPGVGLVSRERHYDIVGKTVRNSASMLQIRLPDDKHRWFKAYCSARGVTMKGVLTAYIDHLRDLEEKVKVVKPL